MSVGCNVVYQNLHHALAPFPKIYYLAFNFVAFFENV